jgi:hypothetical protein
MSPVLGHNYWVILHSHSSLTDGRCKQQQLPEGNLVAFDAKHTQMPAVVKAWKENPPCVVIGEKKVYSWWLNFLKPRKQQNGFLLLQEETMETIFARIAKFKKGSWIEPPELASKFVFHYLQKNRIEIPQVRKDRKKLINDITVQLIEAGYVLYSRQDVAALIGNMMP